MRIKLTDNFFIEQCAYAPFSWDLYTVYKGKRKGEIIEVEKPAGCYGLSLPQIVSKAIDFEIQLSEEKELELREYIERFEKIQKEVLNNLKNKTKW